MLSEKIWKQRYKSKSEQTALQIPYYTPYTFYRKLPCRLPTGQGSFSAFERPDLSPAIGSGRDSHMQSPTQAFACCGEKEVSPYPLRRRKEERTSMAHTRRISPMEMAPALSQAYWFMAKISGAPMPPAPTSPRTEASRIFTSNR